MSPDDATPSNAEIEERLQHAGRYSRLVRAGLAVIVTAFLLAVVGLLSTNVDSPAQVIQAIQMPLTFVGLGLILFGIGMHLHLMHLNLVRQLQPDSDAGSRCDPADDES